MFINYREDICLQALLLLFKCANHRNKRLAPNVSVFIAQSERRTGIARSRVQTGFKSR